MVPLDKELRQVNVKQKPLRQICHSDTFRHNEAYPGIIQAYLGISDCSGTRTHNHLLGKQNTQPFHLAKLVC